MDVAVGAATLCKRNPRFIAAGGTQFLAEAGIRNLTFADPIDAQVKIEVRVSQGFGLDPAMLACVFCPDKDDRRGFWRAFDADPSTKIVGDRVQAAMFVTGQTEHCALP